MDDDKMSFCPRCGKETAAGAAYCGSCGLSLGGGATVYATSGEHVAVAAHATPIAPGTHVTTKGLAIAGLLFNVLIWPGLGTLVAGDKRGWIQAFAYLALGFGVVFLFFATIVAAIAAGPGALLGFFALGLCVLGMGGVWIWALVTSIQHIGAAR